MIPAPAPLRLVQDDPAAPLTEMAATACGATSVPHMPAVPGAAVVQPPTDGSSLAKIGPAEPAPPPPPPPAPAAPPVAPQPPAAAAVAPPMPPVIDFADPLRLVDLLQSQIRELQSEVHGLRRRDETLNFYLSRVDDEMRLAAR